MVEGKKRVGTPWVLVIASVVVILLLVLSGRYGYHRDELYFIEAGERLAWGYVDQPPFTPFIARAAGIFDHSLLALRFLPALAIGGVIVLAGAFARRFGGGVFAQGLAALATGCAGILLALGHLLTTATFDVLAWTLLVYLVVRVIQTGQRRLWLAAGAVAGIGLLNKWTVLFVAGALVLGMLPTEHRRVLREPYLWLGVAIALAIWVPNLIWQSQNGWPFFDMAESLRAEGIDDANSLLFVPMQILLIGPIAAPIWIAGLLSFFRDEHMRTYRFLAWAFIVLVVIFIALASKPYFLAPIYVPLLAAGAVVTERRVARPGGWLNRRLVVGAVLVGGLVGIPISLPALPPDVLADSPLNDINPELGETYGWESFTRQVAAAYERLPEDARSDATVFTISYGEAGAVDLYGPEMGLPNASSGHNNYWLWGPPDAKSVMIVGHFPPGFLERHFVGVEEIATITNEAGLENEEYGARIWVADGPRGSWSEVWPELRHYN